MRFRALLAALVVFAGASAHAGSILTQGQLNTELGTSCAAQGKAAPCIGPAQMQDLITTAVPAVVTGITAAGSNQGGATALTGQVNDVATVAAGTGVVLPTAVAGQLDTVCNDGANSLLVYPASGASIGSNAANSPVGADPGQCLSLVALTSTAWRLIGGNPGSTLAAGFYVSPTGSDSNPGTLSMPFQTLGACQTAMRSGYKICYVRAGTYVLPSGGLSLTASDAGETYQYYPPDGIQSAILSGASLAASTQSLQTATGATGVTINGLAFTRNTTYIVVYIQGNGSVFTNNLIDGADANPWYGLDIYGNNQLVAGNTIQNMGGSGATNAFGIFGNSTGLTHSVVKNNTLQCITGFGIYYSGAAVGNLTANNTIYGIGHSGGSPPTCGTMWNGAGTGIEDLGGTGDLFAGNTVLDVEGYALASVGNSAGGGNVVSDNSLQTNSDPALDLIGGTPPDTNPNGVIRRNTITSPGGPGMNVGDENDTCLRSSTSDTALVANNTISSTYEPFWLTNTHGSNFFGNVTNIGLTTVVATSPHYSSGVTFLNWEADASCTPGRSPDNTGNTFTDNTITSSNASAAYAALYESGQTGNTLSHNILYPFGSPGTAAIQNNSGGSNTDTDNQKTSGGSVSSAPALANAGPSQIVAPGQVVTLNGSGTNFPATTTTGITYLWTQILGAAVTINNSTSAVANFTAPTATQATILGFKLTATNGNGATFDQVYVGVDPSL